MASFSKANTTRTPFGKNAFLRSTQDVKTESYTVAAASFPANATVDGEAKKVLQPGTLMAKITSGDDDGMIGVWDDDATDGRQTTGNIVGLSETFVPWMLDIRDVDIAVVYEATVVEAWCLQHDADAQEAFGAAAKTACQTTIPTINFK